MKSFLILLSLIFTLFLFQSCTDRGVEAPTGGDTRAGTAADLGKVSLSFSNAPSVVAQVVAKLSRDGFAARDMLLSVGSTGGSASGTFNSVEPGVWHLKVDALDSSQVVRYTGETDVEVVASSISHVALHLHPATGSIDITVTWEDVAMTPPPGLVGWWPGDGNAVDIAGQNSAETFNGVTYVPGMVGQAFKFDGVNGYIMASAAGLPSGTHDRTLELWARIDSIVAEESLFAGYGNFQFWGQSYLLTATWGRLAFSQWGDQVKGPLLQTGVWYHIAVTSTGNDITLYVNGSAVAEGYLPFSTSADTCFFLAGRVPGPTNEMRRLNGAVDEISIYDRALTPGEIRDIYLASSAGKRKPS